MSAITDAEARVKRKGVRGFVDLHCHWVAAIDDGAPNTDEGIAMLEALRAIGFDFVMATPHMRPGMFDNTKSDLERAFEAMKTVVAEKPGLPQVGLSSEHYFDDIVFGRIKSGQALPYPGGKAILIEFPVDAFPVRIAHSVFDMRVRQLRPVLAHPERYRPVWDDIRVLDPLVDAGVALLLDVAAVVGKYGRETRQAALKLLENGYYDAACSDAHRAKDAGDVGRGIEKIEKLVGTGETEYLLRDGPLSLLDGTLED